jgi:hypothetical protein
MTDHQRWLEVCAEISAMPDADQHEIPTWRQWYEHFGVHAHDAEKWAEDLDDVEIIGTPEFIDAEGLASGETFWMPFDDDSDYLTVMRSPGRSATKVHTLLPSGEWDTEPHNKATWHDVTLSPKITSLDDLAAILARLESARECFVVRGEPTQSGTLRRRSEDGTFACVDRRWLMIDIDDCPGDSVTEAIALLPDYFRDVACWYQYSASAGIKPGVKVHLWYWLDRPVCCFSLRQWAKSLSGIVDASLYNPVQVHYTARPVFKNAEDPLPNRSGMIPGRPVLSLPATVVDLAAWRAMQPAPRPAPVGRQIESVRAGSMRERYALRALEKACNDVRCAGEGNRHLTLIAAACAIGELLAYVNESTAHNELVAAAMDAFGSESRRQEAEKTVRDGLARGRANPRDLSHIGMIDLPPAMDDEIEEMLAKLETPKEMDKMEYIRILFPEPRPGFAMSYCVAPDRVIYPEIWYYPADDYVERVSAELALELNFCREIVRLEDLPNNTHNGVGK